MRVGIFGEVSASGMSSQTKTAIGKVADMYDSEGLSDLCDKSNKQCLDLILIGNQEFKNIDLTSLPCDYVLIYDNIIGNDVVEMTCRAVEHYLCEYNPDVIIDVREKATDIVVPLVAHRMNTNGFLDCTNMLYDEDTENIVVEKSVYSGNATAQYHIKKCCILAFRQGIKSKSSLMLGQPEIKRINYHCKCNSTQIFSKEFEPIASDGLVDADFVIVCGYGVGSKKEVERIENIAKKIGAAIGGTKKIIDVGWLSIHKLIGQTGQTIAPKICLTVGVSGAMPLINGIIDSQQIIAINTDKNARIFNYANIGIQADYEEIFSELESIINKQR